MSEPTANTGTALELRTFRQGPFWNLTYLVGSRGGSALLIDPAWDLDDVVAETEKMKLSVEMILLTHGHHDHMNALAAAVNWSGAPVFVQRAEASLVQKEYPGNVTLVDGAATLAMGGATVFLQPSPGHTPGSQTISVGQYLATGDTLLSHGPGRAGVFPDAEALLRESVRDIFERYPGTTRVLPGHDTGRETTPPLKTIHQCGN